MELVSLGLLFYVLRQNGRTSAHIGFTFRWRDVRTGIVLKIGAGLATYVAAFGIFRAYEAAMKHPPTQPSIPGAGIISPWLVIFVLINPFFEELIVRAYMISEIVSLTGNTTVAVVASVVLQTTYHLYQGVAYALMAGVTFLVFSIYYARTRRIWPVILAHLWFDFSALILYPIINLKH
jgi:membrane protease YdiL (CAAX protease family)